ncbi:MAG: hypothetical protein ACTSR3_03895 [Candidatus Helarchaeota archaeon]
MKQKITITLIFLMLLSIFLMFFIRIPESNAQVQVNYASYDYTNVAGTDINASIQANVGVLTDGGISLWGIEPTIITNSSITLVIIRGESNGSKFSRGLTFPSTAEFKDDTQLHNNTVLSMNIFSDPFKSIKENLLIRPDIYGIPNLYSFNVSIFLGNATSNQTICLTSGNNPLVTVIFRNPEATPEINTLFFTLLYTLPFILPISIIIIYIASKRIKKPKESNNGGLKNET